MTEDLNGSIESTTMTEEGEKIHQGTWRRITGPGTFDTYALPVHGPGLPFIPPDPPPNGLWTQQNQEYWLYVDEEGNLYCYGNPVLSITTTLILPSGDVSGATDVANINAALAAGQKVQLVPTGAWNSGGAYFINAPINVPNQGCIWGGQSSQSSQNDNYSAGVGISNGSVIVATGAFTGATGIMQMINTSGSTQNTGVDIRDITLECFEVSTGPHGIYVSGAWGACSLKDVTVHRPPGDCLHMVTGAGKIPDDWTVTRCKFSASRTGYGVYLAECADSWFTDCESSENLLDGWYINYGLNTRYTSCKGENNGNLTTLSYGFHCTGTAINQIIWFTGSSTHLNSAGGWLFDNGGPSGGGLGTYLLNGCTMSSDGYGAPTSSAGITVSGCNSRVVANGCIVDIGTFDSATAPFYGANQINTSFYTQLDGCYLGNNTGGATHDDGSNTHALVANNSVAH